MKTLLLVLVLLMAAPPVQAAYCDMESGQGSVQSGQSEPRQPVRDGHDCCPGDTSGEAPDEANVNTDCSSGAHCNACFLMGAALPVYLSFATTMPNVVFSGVNPGLMALSHSYPPFRPPIA